MLNDDGPGRGQWSIAFDGVFGPYFLGKLLANIGIWVFSVAAIILVYETTQSAFLVGVVSVVQFLPQMLLVTASGAAADRGNRKLQFLIGRSLCMLGPGSLAIWMLWSAHTPPAWLVMAAALTVGLGFAVGGPAMQAILPSLVRPRELPHAVALDNVSFAVGRAAGPAIGGVLAATMGLDWAFAAAAILHLAFFIAIVLMPATPRLLQSAKRESMWAGLRYAARVPAVIPILLAVTTIGIAADPGLTLAPGIANQIGSGPELVGMFASAFGLGAFIAFFPQARLTAVLGSRRLAPTGLVMMAAGCLGLIPASAAWLALLWFSVMGAGMTLSLTALGIEIYSRIPDAYRGRVMALWLLGFMGARPFAALVNGSLAETAGVGVALAVTAVCPLAAAWICRPSVLR
ncbi:MFS transporter [Microbacterium profundi]|uniref:MFS transporter n=1 Tax=Microbacterium profundi TaxID=450380 RepID=A0ABV3LGF3_9MICO